jgi:anti-anti-sigma regulatory factor
MNTVHTVSHFAQDFASGRQATTVVLQPHGSLGQLEGSFGTSLSQALDQADEVIVDLLWAETVDDTGIKLLLNSMETAKAQGKILSFLGMNSATRAALDKILEQQHDSAAMVQSECFLPDFEQFLETYKEEQATMQSRPIS